MSYGLSLNSSQYQINVPSLTKSCSFPTYSSGCFYNNSLTQVNVSSCTFDEEYSHFLQSNKSVKGVIIHLCIPVTLCTASESHRHFIDIRVTILSWYKYFNQVPQYPWVLFTVNSSVNVLRSYIDTLSPTIDTVKLIQVVGVNRLFDTSVHRHSETSRNFVGCAAGFTSSYRAMNEFFSYGMFTHSALLPYDYWLRADIDSPLVAPLCQDPLYKLYKENLIFLTLPFNLVKPSCHVGFISYFIDYLDDLKLEINPFNLLHKLMKTTDIVRSDCSSHKPCHDAYNKTALKHYINKLNDHDSYNFTPGFPGCVGAGKLEWYRSSLYLDFARKVAENDYFMTHRWSDQAMYYAGAVLSDFTNNGSVGKLTTTAIHYKFNEEFTNCSNAHFAKY